VAQEPAEPIAEAHKARFEAVRDRVIAELNGTEIPNGPITEDDIFGRTATEEVQNEQKSE
jgi:hypothetical protein